MTLRFGLPNWCRLGSRRRAVRSEQQLTQPSHGIARILLEPADEPAVHEIARFLEKLEQKVLLLSEQPNRGRTEIERLEQTAADFAIVLLTPSDRGGAAQVPFAEQRSRARQKVILELGRLLGVLGRDRVCALYLPKVELPSEREGLFCLELDESGAWKLLLARELKAHFDVDLNNAV